MKKLTPLFFALTAALILSACGEAAKSPYQTYMDASRRLSEQTAFEADSFIRMVVHYNEDYDISMEGSVQQITRSETDLEVSMDMHASFLGMEQGTAAYYRDGICYLDTQGMKYRMALPVDEILGQVNLEPLTFEESAVSEQSMTETDAGKNFSFTLDSAAVGSLMQNQLAGTADMLGEVAEYNFQSVRLTGLVDKNGDLRATHIEMEMELTMGGETVPVSTEVSLTFTAFGEDVTVQAPENLDEYLEMPGY